MSWNAKHPSLVARPELRAGRSLYRVTNEGASTASRLRATLRVGDADHTEALLLGRMPVELPPGGSFLLGQTPGFAGAGVLTLLWQAPDGTEGRWHGVVSGW